MKAVDHTISIDFGHVGLENTTQRNTEVELTFGFLLSVVLVWNSAGTLW